MNVVLPRVLLLMLLSVRKEHDGGDGIAFAAALEDAGSLANAWFCPCVVSHTTSRSRIDRAGPCPSVDTLRRRHQGHDEGPVGQDGSLRKQWRS